MFCPHCGNKVISHEARYCTNCGTELNNQYKNEEEHQEKVLADKIQESVQIKAESKKTAIKLALKRSFWPDVDTPAAALSARMYGVWMAVFTASIDALLSFWSLASGKKVLGIFDESGFIDSSLFAAIAFGIYKKSRFAAIAGLTLFTIEKAVKFAVSPKSMMNGGNGMGVLIVLCYVAAIRGTFALRRFTDKQ